LRKVILDVFFAENRFVFEHVGFESGDAAETPADVGQSMDEVLLGGAGGFIEAFVVGAEGVEVFLGFAGEGVELGG
jgi:hypothetical protein